MQIGSKIHRAIFLVLKSVLVRFVQGSRTSLWHLWWHGNNSKRTILFMIPVIQLKGMSSWKICWCTSEIKVSSWGSDCALFSPDSTNLDFNNFFGLGDVIWYSPRINRIFWVKPAHPFGHLHYFFSLVLIIWYLFHSLFSLAFLKEIGYSWFDKVFFYWKFIDMKFLIKVYIKMLICLF